MKTKNLTNLKKIKKRKPQKQTKPNTRKKQKKTTLKKETIFTKINSWLKKRGLSPIISVILLVVVSVILVLLILSWGKDFTTESTGKTNDITKLKPADATYYIYPKSTKDGVIEFNYTPPNELAKEELIIKGYIVANIPEMTEPIKFKETIKLSNTNILELPCLYEYSSTTPDLYIQLITTNDTYIDIKIKEQGMVCVSGESGDANVICTANDLNNIRNNLEGNYTLGKDIDLGCFLEQDINGWEPIETSSANFTGMLDGKNHTISNLYINRPEEENVGLFGGIGEDSEIKNLMLKDIRVLGKKNVGSLVGYNYNGNIENNYVTGEVNVIIQIAGGLVGLNLGNIENSYVTGEVKGNSNVGGLVGLNEGNIENSYATGIVSGISFNTGGLVGENYGTIENSYATGEVKGNSNVGGLVGHNYDGGTIEKNYATGDVNGHDNVGGLVGRNVGGTIEKNYATGDVNGHDNVGGLVGRNFTYLNNNYAIGDVNGHDNVGGLVGYNEGLFFTGGYKIENSYSLGKITGMGVSFGGLIGKNVGNYINYCYWNSYTSGLNESDGGEPKTTEEMKDINTYTDELGDNRWNFETVWAISPSVNNGYPHLLDNPP